MQHGSKHLVYIVTIVESMYKDMTCANLGFLHLSQVFSVDRRALIVRLPVLIHHYHQHSETATASSRLVHHRRCIICLLPSILPDLSYTHLLRLYTCKQPKYIKSRAVLLILDPAKFGWQTDILFQHRLVYIHNTCLFAYLTSTYPFTRYLYTVYKYSGIALHFIVFPDRNRATKSYHALFQLTVAISYFLCYSQTDIGDLSKEKRRVTCILVTL